MREEHSEFRQVLEKGGFPFDSLVPRDKLDLIPGVLNAEGERRGEKPLF